MTILSRGIRLAIGALALCVASSAGAQENLDKGKTGAQIYASNCAACHKSPQSVIKTIAVSGLENFLSVHYAANPESAAKIAAYLKGLEKRKARSARQTAHTSQANPSQPTPSEPKEESYPESYPGQRALMKVLKKINPDLFK
jgi:mono/diheme cytochrome c family protein